MKAKLLLTLLPPEIKIKPGLVFQFHTNLYCKYNSCKFGDEICYYLHQSKINQDDKLPFHKKNIINLFELLRCFITKAEILEKGDIFNVVTELENGIKEVRAVANGN